MGNFKNRIASDSGWLKLILDSSLGLTGTVWEQRKEVCGEIICVKKDSNILYLGHGLFPKPISVLPYPC